MSTTSGWRTSKAVHAADPCLRIEPWRGSLLGHACGSSHGHSHPVVAPTQLARATEAVGAWALLPRVREGDAILEWNSIAENALRLAMTLSDEVEVLHIDSEDSSNSLRRSWPARVEKPARESKRVVPRLTVLHSPFRFVVQPIIDHVMHITRQTPERTVAVLLPELIERRWYQYFLHNQRAGILAARLLTEGTDRIVIVNVPWYLRKRSKE
jgi:hypothetical protein